MPVMSEAFTSVKQFVEWKTPNHTVIPGIPDLDDDSSIHILHILYTYTNMKFNPN